MVVFSFLSIRFSNCFPMKGYATFNTFSHTFLLYPGLSLYKLKQNGVLKILRDDLSVLQKKIIKILGIPEYEFWSEGNL